MFLIEPWERNYDPPRLSSVISGSCPDLGSNLTQNNE